MASTGRIDARDAAAAAAASSSSREAAAAASSERFVASPLSARKDIQPTVANKMRAFAKRTKELMGQGVSNFKENNKKLPNDLKKYFTDVDFQIKEEAKVLGKQMGAENYAKAREVLQKKVGFLPERLETFAVKVQKKVYALVRALVGSVTVTTTFDRLPIVHALRDGVAHAAGLAGRATVYALALAGAGVAVALAAAAVVAVVGAGVALATAFAVSALAVVALGVALYFPGVVFVGFPYLAYQNYQLNKKVDELTERLGAKDKFNDTPELKEGHAAAKAVEAERAEEKRVVVAQLAPVESKAVEAERAEENKSALAIAEKTTDAATGSKKAEKAAEPSFLEKLVSASNDYHVGY